MRLSHPGQKTTKSPPPSSARFTGFRGWIGVVGVEKKRLPRRKERSRNGVADVGLGRPWG